MPSCSAITSTLPASNIIRRIYPPADEVCLLAGPERPLAQVTQDTSAWPELNVCWLVGMSLALLAISVGVPTIVGMRRNAQDHNSTARRRGGDSCPECGTTDLRVLSHLPVGQPDPAARLHQSRLRQGFG
jgi:hypothetical protein